MFWLLRLSEVRLGLKHKGCHMLTFSQGLLKLISSKSFNIKTFTLFSFPQPSSKTQWYNTVLLQHPQHVEQDTHGQSRAAGYKSATAAAAATVSGQQSSDELQHVRRSPEAARDAQKTLDLVRQNGLDGL